MDAEERTSLTYRDGDRVLPRYPKGRSARRLCSVAQRPCWEGRNPRHAGACAACGKPTERGAA